MTFIEATVFTKRIIELGAEESYRALQNELAANPDAGDVIPGLDGLRKIRLALPGRGKSGAARTLYLLFTRARTVVFLLVYTKNDFEDLSPEVKKVLRQRIASIRKEFEK
jgi:hypothetical protein